MTKRELVVLLKPTVIHDDRSWVRDLEQSSERMRNMGMPQSAFTTQ
jgi:type II secretory pathway component GspD/PulD (secretin)